MTENITIDFNELSSYWVSEADTLLIKTDPFYDACTEKCQRSKIYVISEGYKMAADCIVDCAESKSNLNEKDFFIYPIIFNYRHYVELKIKKIISQYGSPVGIGPCWNDHNLEKLANKLKKIVGFYEAGSESKDTKKILEHIRQLHDIDQGSYDYRYPVDKNGQPLQDMLGSVNLKNLKRVMNTIYKYFDWLDSFLCDNDLRDFIQID